MTHKEMSSSTSSSMMMKKEIHQVEESSSISSSSAHHAMMSSMMESSSFSSMAAEMKFETMSMSSMSSMASEKYAMSSSSLTEMTAHLQGSSLRAIGRFEWLYAVFLVALNKKTQNIVPLLCVVTQLHCNPKSAPLPGSAPRIEALPEDISIEPGKVLTVACAFSGDAKHIEWSHRGKTIQVTAGGRFHIETTEDLTTLIITGVREEDAGAYTLKLSNQLGSDSATVHISIRSV